MPPTPPAPRLPVWISLSALLALAVGGTLGFWSHLRPGSVLAPAGEIAAALGDLWLSALRATVVPLVVTFVAAAVTSAGSARRAGRLAGAAVAAFTLLLLLSVAYAATAGAWISPRLAPTETALAAGAARASAGVDPSPGPASLADGIREWLPANLFAAAADDQVVALVLFSAVFGLAVLRLPEDTREVLTAGIRGLAGAVLTVVVWILILMPIGVFGLAWGASEALGLDLARVLAVWIVGTSVLVGSFTLFLLPLGAVLGRIRLRDLAAALGPAQLIAAGGRSSLATLPALMEGALGRLRAPERRAGFVLPLSTAAFKIGGTMNAVFALFLLARVHDISLTPGGVAGFLLGVALLSYATPGIPSGGFTLRLPLFAAVGVPLESLVLLHAVDAVPDIFKTVANTTTAMVVLVVASRLLGAEPREAAGGEVSGAAA